jgi:hypothetical protein
VVGAEISGPALPRFTSGVAAASCNVKERGAARTTTGRRTIISVGSSV